MPTVLVDTPLAGYTWNQELVLQGNSAVGISGTHTALLAAANQFALQGWNTTLAGSVRPTSVAVACGVEYVPAAENHRAFTQSTPRFNLTVMSNLVKPSQAFHRVNTAHLAVLMEMQTFPAREAQALHEYVDAQRAANRAFRLTFAHLSGWGRRVLKQWAPNHGAAWMLEPWVRHVDFGNPVALDLVRHAQQRAAAREESSFIFPACTERGGGVAARVYARLRPRWLSAGHTPHALWAAYGTSAISRAEEQAVRRHAGGGTDVTITKLSKAALMKALQTAGFFVYALASTRSVVRPPSRCTRHGARMRSV